MFVTQEFREVSMHGNGSGHGRSVAEWRAHVEHAYERHAERIASALSRTFGAARAEDAVQEMFMRALSWNGDRDRLRCMMNFRFMVRCASRVALRHIRTETRRARRERTWSESARPGCPWGATPANRLERQEGCDAAAKLLGELPSWQRPAVQMMVVDRRRYRDVERITGVRSTTLNNWRHRFAAELKDRLDPRQ
jgi:DNA-directed RNA polymerase specialized sigma24 family protein